MEVRAHACHCLADSEKVSSLEKFTYGHNYNHYYNDYNNANALKSG